MSYTKINKPTGTTYTKQSRSVNYPQYGTAIYGTSKYGIVNNYTSVSKPTTGQTWATMTVTWASQTGQIWGSPNYYMIAKPTI